MDRREATLPKSNASAPAVPPTKVRKSRGTVLPGHKSRSAGTGVSWQRDGFARHDEWMLFYRLLVRFHGDHGHCNVPAKKPFQRLAAWCSRQREIKRHGRLSDLRRGWLDELGFRWSGRIRRVRAGNRAPDFCGPEQNLARQRVSMASKQSVKLPVSSIGLSSQ